MPAPATANGSPWRRASSPCRLAMALLVAAPLAAQTTLADPSAVFCAEQGGRFESRSDVGGQRGVCILPDGTEVDAWDYFREHHAEPAPGDAGTAE